MSDVFGVPMPDLPTGAQPLEAVVLVKVLTDDGHICLCERASAGLTAWEALGMATTYADTLRHQLQGGFTEDDD